MINYHDEDEAYAMASKLLGYPAPTDAELERHGRIYDNVMFVIHPFEAMIPLGRRYGPPVALRRDEPKFKGPKAAYHAMQYRGPGNIRSMKR